MGLKLPKHCQKYQEQETRMLPQTINRAMPHTRNQLG